MKRSIHLERTLVSDKARDNSGRVKITACLCVVMMALYFLIYCKLTYRTMVISYLLTVINGHMKNFRTNLESYNSSLNVNGRENTTDFLKQFRIMRENGSKLRYLIASKVKRGFR